MKFSIAKNAFAKEVADVFRAIPAKATIPILTEMKIQVTEDGIYLTGSDSEISIESFIDIKDSQYDLSISQTGSIAVAASLFNNIIRRLPEDTIEFAMDPHNFSLKITSGSAVFNLNGQDGNQYPRLPEFDEENKVSLPAHLIKEMIENTIFSASNQEVRPILTGLNLVAQPTHLTATATDSHRLSRRQIPVEIDSSILDFGDLNIPKKTVTELARIIEDEETIDLIVSGKQVIFLLGHLTIYSRLLDGNYPDTNRLIPQSSTTHVVINSTEFQQALDRASLMSHEGRNNVVQLTIENGQVSLSVAGNDRGKVFEVLPIKSLEGEDLMISFNPDYMKEALRPFNGVDVTIQLNTPISPMLITSLEPSELAHNDLLQLLTPIRTHQNY